MNIRKNLLIWILITVVLVVLFDILGSPGAGQNNLAFSDFLSRVEAGEISDVSIQGRTLEGHFAGGQLFSTYLPDYPNLIDKLKSAGVTINVYPTESKMGSFLGIILSWFPMLLLIGVWLFFM